MKNTIRAMIVTLCTFFFVNSAHAIVANAPSAIEDGVKNAYNEKVKTDRLLAQPTEGEATTQKTLNDQLKKLTEDTYVRASVTLPGFKIYKSKKPDTMADVAIMSGIGGGISIVKYDEAASKVSIQIPADGDKSAATPVIDLKTKYSFSPVTILMSKDATENINVSYAMTFGMFNDKIMLGFGYDFGTVHNQNRFFTLLSMGVSF